MKVNNLLQEHRSTAEGYLEKGYIREISFSGRTYQVEVVIGEKEIWPFLQFDEENHLQDAFCSCEKCDEEGGCPHLAAAYLKIYNGHLDPLHIRFQESLWHHLCWIYATREGCDSEILEKRENNCYVLEREAGTALFFIEGKSEEIEEKLSDILERRRLETEETSIKFSTLSQREIDLWKEGRPSPTLRYELSFWADIAKWLMMRQEKDEEYSIDFRYSPSGAPNQLWITFSDLSLAFFLPKSYWPKIIPSLTMVNSPLPVYNFNEEAIDRILYDKEKRIFRIEVRKEMLKGIAKAKENVNSAEEVISLGEWRFIKGRGFFYGGEHHLFSTDVIKEEEIADTIDEHYSLLKRHLSGTKIHDKAIHLRYQIFFDKKWNLHILSFLEKEGDLQSGFSAYFDRWLYVDEKGFYPLEDELFGSVEKVIPKNEVGSFIHRYRSWLGKQEGFNTHLSSLEDRLIYKVDEKGTLSFRSRIEAQSENFEGHDFGDWYYIKGQGFYTKMRHRVGLPVRPGILIEAEELPSFIKRNREELDHVNNFFAEECPILKSGLKISLDEEHHITVIPEYTFLEDYSKEGVRFFGDYTYIDDLGFYELPLNLRLPEEYRQKEIIKGKRIPLFLKYEIENLRRFVTSIDKRLSKGEDGKFVVQEVEGEEKLEERGWLAFDMVYQTSIGSISLKELWSALHSRRSFLFSEAGLIDLSEERFQWIARFGEERISKEKGFMQLSVLDFLRLNAFEKVEDFPRKAEREKKSETFSLLRQLRELKVSTKPDLSGLESQLRPYQVVGLDWLWFLYSHHLAGLLCDDMGLGKTHQAMALMAAAINHAKKNRGGRKYFLVVCPTSVIYHWQEKLEQFLPGVSVCTFHGAERSIDGFLVHHDILLTSYGIMRREKELISLISFDMAVFDEVQVAKNHLSKLHQSLLTVKARMRLGLTGTPIENQLRELKSLFDIVLPTYMPNEGQFRDMFVHPIEKEGDQKRKGLLQRFIKPFVLRRKKEEVLQDLPEKTEEVSHCGLSTEQRKLYNEVLKGSSDALLDELQDQSKSISYMHIFAVLTRLKQICNHPALVKQDLRNYRQYSSGKWELFRELISQARESGQKVVVFSHYLGMLDIIEKYLKEEEIGYASLRGSTVDRGKEMKRFQKEKECGVFVASLMAAGLGIDLTAASVVIHYDRWWNAARENQATDRVHRIGQTRGVQVFKLVTLNTLEEKIDLLITKKEKLMEEVVGSDDVGQLKQFDRKELIALLQFVEEG